MQLRNNQDATSRGALAGFAFHTSLLFKDTQGRERNHLSQREAQRLEAPAAEKPVYFGWQNTLEYGCIRVHKLLCIQVFSVCRSGTSTFEFVIIPKSSCASVLIKII